MTRHFLFLQGPHGPFFSQLSKVLRRAGCVTTRIGFNAGDAVFWSDKASYVPFDQQQPYWGDWVDDLMGDRAITDIVLYGDTRPIHAEAIKRAHQRGVAVHVFEEGYMRPYWVTYERNGANGHSKLMDLPISKMARALDQGGGDMPEPPAHWGDMREHVFYGALYHWFVLFWNRRYRHFQPHREQPLLSETLQYSRRLALMPVIALDRAWATRRVRAGGYPYHLALLQLDHDANFRAHSPYRDTPDFLGDVIQGFARGAPPHHHLVIKAHPLESGRINLREIIRGLAAEQGVAGRVHYVRGGKLARLLDHARSAVTVNSTAGQQALWRNIPLRAFGQAVYCKPELVSDQTMQDFFAAPRRPNPKAYDAYRLFLLETSQVTGGFYSRSGRRQLLRQIVDLMLAPVDPYDALITGRDLRATENQPIDAQAQLRLGKSR